MEQPKNTYMYVRWLMIRIALVMYDIVSVNIAYFAALVIRFYVASEFNMWAVRYIPAFWTFAPYYTVACLVIFGLFKLYNSRWKYAGLYDLNRILMACLTTSVVQVVGSVVFVLRMPITYYVIGGAIQFGLIAASRFAYRFFLMEQSRLRKERNRKTAINVMVVGMGETSRIVLKHLEQDADNAAHPVCLVDFRGGVFENFQGGLPIISGIDKISLALQKYGAENVILADTTMPQNIKDRIREICQEAGVAVQDFSGYFQDTRGAITLRNLLEYTKGSVELVVNGKQRVFDNGEQAFLSLSGKYVVNTISAKENRLVIELQTDILVPNDVREEWVQNYRQETGKDISFF